MLGDRSFGPAGRAWASVVKSTPAKRINVGPDHLNKSGP